MSESENKMKVGKRKGEIIQRHFSVQSKSFILLYLLKVNSNIVMNIELIFLPDHQELKRIMHLALEESIPPL